MSSSKNRGCQGLNRTSEMVKDEEGFYRVTLGRYGTESVHKYKLWPLEQDVLTKIQERADRGLLCGEFGLPGQVVGEYMDNKQFLSRFLLIKEDNVACQYKDIQVHSFNSLQIVTAKMKPAGPHADGLQYIIDQGKETLVFGHRAMMKAGSGGRHIETIVTWDIVKMKEQPTTA